MVIRKMRGFSLTELIVALVIVGVVGFLAAIAGVAVLNRNASRVAEANAQAVAQAERAFQVRNGTYTGSPGDLGDIKDTVVITAVSQNKDEVSIALGTKGSVGIAVQENSSTCILMSLASTTAGGALVRQVTGPNDLCIGVSALPYGEAPATDSAATQVN